MTTAAPQATRRAGQPARLARACCACLLFLATAANARANRYLVVFSVQLRNTGAQTLRHVYLRLAVPTTNEYQIIRGVTIAPREESRQDVPGGDQVALLEFRELAAGQSAWAFLLVATEPRDIQAGKGLIRRALPREVERQCLGPSYKVDPALPELRDLAATVTPEEKDPFVITRALVEYICSEFRYELDDRQDDVPTVLLTRCGSCSELSRLFVALCRARGIPARFASGSRLRERKTDVYADVVHHRWVEVFLPKFGWFPIDISMAVNRADPERRFGVIPRDRLVLLRNAGIEDSALYSSGLALVTPAESIATTVRSYWFQEGASTLRRAMKLVRDRTRSEPPGTGFREALLGLPGVQAIPFLAMALHEPVAAGEPALATAALARTRTPAAAAPLADFAALHTVLPEYVTDALLSLTSQRFESGEATRLWLIGPGLGFLRGETAVAPPAPLE